MRAGPIRETRRAELDRIPKPMIIDRWSDGAAGLGREGGTAEGGFAFPPLRRRAADRSWIVRPEHGGPMTLDELVEFLGRNGCR